MQNCKPNFIQVHSCLRRLTFVLILYVFALIENLLAWFNNLLSFDFGKSNFLNIHIRLYIIYNMTLKIRRGSGGLAYIFIFFARQYNPFPAACFHNSKCFLKRFRRDIHHTQNMNKIMNMQYVTLKE